MGITETRKITPPIRISGRHERHVRYRVTEHLPSLSACGLCQGDIPPGARSHIYEGIETPERLRCCAPCAFNLASPIPQSWFAVSRVREIWDGLGDPATHVLADDYPMTLWETVEALRGCQVDSHMRGPNAIPLFGDESAFTNDRQWYGDGGGEYREVVTVRRIGGGTLDPRMLGWLFRAAEAM